MSCGHPGAGEDSDTVMPRKSKFDKGKSCVKCKIAIGNVVIRHAVYCKTCFFPMVTSKMRRVLEPSVNDSPDTRRTNLKASGNLLIGFSGGLGSSTLIDFISRTYFTAPSQQPVIELSTQKLSGGRDYPRNERVWKKAFVCYVEICGGLPELHDRTEEIRNAVEQYREFEFITLRLEDAFDERWWSRVGGRVNLPNICVSLGSEDLNLGIPEVSSSHQTPVDLLHAYLDSLPTQTALVTAIGNLIRLLLMYTAHSLSASHLLFGTSLTSLSISLISSVAQGGGFTVREEAQEEWTSEEINRRQVVQQSNEFHEVASKHAVRIIRPLRDVGMKECTMWSWWTKLKVVGKQGIPGVKQSIPGLTKGAVTLNALILFQSLMMSPTPRLHNRFGKRLPFYRLHHCPHNSKTSRERLLVYEMRALPAEDNVLLWKSSISVRSLSPSHHLATPPPNSDILSPGSSMARVLCYACHATLTSQSSRGLSRISKNSTLNDNSLGTAEVPLPVWVRSRLQRINSVSDSRDNTSHESTSASEAEIWQRRRVDEDQLKTIVGEYLLPD